MVSPVKIPRTPREAVHRARQMLAMVSERRRGWSPVGREEVPRLAPAGAGGGYWPPAPTGAATAVAARWPASIPATLRHADRVLEGRFRLLGWSDIRWPIPIDWHFEPLQGRRAPMRHWRAIPFLNADEVGDHKVLWELNRQQYLVTLAQAKLLSGDARYSRHAVRLMTEWLEANPPAWGINWASSLEVAFRAISWLWTIRLLGAEPAFESGELRAVEEGLYCHGRHLERHLSTYFSPNTHLTGEALALLYLGLALQNGPAPKRWEDLGREILLEELTRQVQPDGTHFEQSPWYHRYTIDFYLHALLLGGWTPGQTEALRTTLREMTRALVHLVRPDGSLPLVGDDDGGSLLRLDETSITDARGTLALAGAVLRQSEAKFLAGSAPVSLWWLLGTEGVNRYDELPTAPPAELSVQLGNAGWHLMRDSWDGEANWLFFDAGPVGALSGGHGHADVLTFEACVDGRPVLVDPGTGAYVGELRDRLRGTAAHNGLTIADESSSIPGGPFRWRTRATGRTIRVVQGERARLIVAEQDGFERLDPPVEQQRSLVAVERAGWVVEDVVSGRAARKVAQHFQCGVEVRVEWIDGHPLLLPAGGRRGLLMLAAAPGTWTYAEGLVSPGYGQAQSAPHLSFEWSAGVSRCPVLLLCTKRPDHIRFGWEVSDTAFQLEVTVDGEHHLISLGGLEPGPSSVKWSVDGRLAGRILPTPPPDRA